MLTFLRRDWLALLECYKESIYAVGLQIVIVGHGKTLGNRAMIPGSFIIDEKGTIQWIHYNKHAGDHPKLENIVQAGKTLSK